MSTQNQISVSIDAETLSAVSNHLTQVKTLLAPFLHPLTAEDRKALFKMGDKTIATVLKTKSFIETNPEFVPSYMDKEEFLKDALLAEQLTPLANLAQQITRDLEDTVMAAGSDSIQAAMLYYGQVKEASARGIASAKPVYDDLSQRFVKKKTKKSTTV